VDLWHYGELVRLASDVAGISGVEEINQQIETLIKESVEALGTPLEDALIVIVGDGATLVFDVPAQAYKFAEELHRRTAAQNAAKRGPEGNKYFRVGVRLGDILLRKMTIDGKFIALNLVGTTVVDAVRLQEASRPGGVVVCAESFAELPSALQVGLSPQGDVKGKHPVEVIPAHRGQIVQGP